MQRKKNYRALLPMIVGVVLLLVMIGFAIQFISNLKNDKKEKKEKKPQQVTLVKPPPPPPPPPKVEKPPEPPKEKLEEPQPEPEPEPEEPVPDVDEAPPADLGLDAEGTAGADGFGLVGRKGGRGLFGGGGGSPFARYGNMIEKEIQLTLTENEKLRQKAYSVVIKVLLKPDGDVEKIELARGSNDPKIDEQLNLTLNKIKRFSEKPPAEMPRTMKFKISAKI